MRAYLEDLSTLTLYYTIVYFEIYTFSKFFIRKFL